MSSTAPTQQTRTVDQPRHPLYALTTFELRRYRRELESAIAFFGTKDPVPPAQADLQARLDAVMAEHDDRTRLAAQNMHHEAH